MALTGLSTVNLRDGIDLRRADEHALLGCLRLPAQPEYVRQARAFLRMLLALNGAELGSVEAAELIMSELVTNVVQHNDWDDEPFVLLALGRDRSTLRVEVHDSDAYMGARRDLILLSENGRGLDIVEMLSERAGIQETPGGKQIWAELTAWPRKSDDEA